MNHSSSYLNSKFGFTIVELLVVIVIIGILAAITIVSYTGISQRAIVSSLQSDLNNAANKMHLDYITNGTISTSFPSGVKSSPGIGLSLSSTGNSNSFCINGQATASSQALSMYYNSTYGAIQTGACSGDMIFGSELGMAKNLVYNTSFSNISGTGWGLILSTSGGFTLTTRPGVSSDPITNKPILILTNTTSKAEAWAVIFGHGSFSELRGSSSYDTSYWVRTTGGFNYNISTIGVLDTNGTNKALNYNIGVTPVSTSWQKVTSHPVAIKDGASSNVFYLPINISAFLNIGWSLEFQDPQVKLQ